MEDLLFLYWLLQSERRIKAFEQDLNSMTDGLKEIMRALAGIDSGQGDLHPPSKERKKSPS